MRGWLTFPRVSALVRRIGFGACATLCLMSGGLMSGGLMSRGLISAAAASGAARGSIETAPVFIVEGYRIKAKNGDARAMVRLGILCERGLISGTPDPKCAAAWYGQAAESGLAKARFMRARMYADGIGGPRDPAAAAALYRAAAEQGMAEAQFNLAIMLQNGRGVPRDVQEAIRWYEQAAFRGIVPAMRALGILYVGGVGDSPRDMVEAWAWLTLAAETATRRRPGACPWCGRP